MDHGFSQQQALNEIGAHYAYGGMENDIGFRGAGVTIAVVADGVETTSRITSLRDEEGDLRVDRMTQITVGTETITAPNTAAQDCGYSSPWTCFGTRTAAVMAGVVPGATTQGRRPDGRGAAGQDSGCACGGVLGFLLLR